MNDVSCLESFTLAICICVAFSDTSEDPITAQQ